ncbi:MAG TPA: hypothetical protein VMZ28_17010 [Kofleriaceae bacterium]|nr:hypothetical protein [Kofleriaceae bacterium]
MIRPSVVASIVLATTACRSNDHQEPPPQAAPARAIDASIAPPAPPVVLDGDAATNPACKLATDGEMQAIAHLALRDKLGTTAPGPYGDEMLSCTWHFEDTEIHSPGIVVQYEVMRRERPDLVAYNKSLIAQGVDAAIPVPGDVGIFAGHTSEVVDGVLHAFVRAQLHDVPEERDLNLAVLGLVLPRMPHPAR